MGQLNGFLTRTYAPQLQWCQRFMLWKKDYSCWSFWCLRSVNLFLLWWWSLYNCLKILHESWSLAGGGNVLCCSTWRHFCYIYGSQFLVMLQTAEMFALWFLETLLKLFVDQKILFLCFPTDPTVGLRKMLFFTMLSKMPTDGVRKLVIFLCAHMRWIYVHMFLRYDWSEANVFVHNIMLQNHSKIFSTYLKFSEWKIVNFAPYSCYYLF